MVRKLRPPWLWSVAGGLLCTQGPSSEPPRCHKHGSRIPRSKVFVSLVQGCLLTEAQERSPGRASVEEPLPGLSAGPRTLSRGQAFPVPAQGSRPVLAPGRQVTQAGAHAQEASGTPTPPAGSPWSPGSHSTPSSGRPRGTGGQAGILGCEGI